MIADGIESLSDVIGSTVVYLGLCLSIKTPDEDHSYGHGKAEPAASIIVSLALIVALIVIWVESIVPIQTPHPLPEAYTLWGLLRTYSQIGSADLQAGCRVGLRPARELRRRGRRQRSRSGDWRYSNAQFTDKLLTAEGSFWLIPPKHRVFSRPV